MPKPGIMYRLIAISAGIVVAGIILSGPPAVYLVSLIHPQPEWVNVQTFIENYHPIQNLPWAGGFLLILGFSFFIASAFQLAVSPTQKVPGTLAIIFVAIYAVLIGFNYSLQVGWVPVLVRDQSKTLEIITMSNPKSVAWILELFGYGFLGLATWCISMVFWGSKKMNIIRYLLIANGVISIFGAVLTTNGVVWILSTTGKISYAAWNILIIITMALIYVEFRKRRLRGGH